MREELNLWNEFDGLADPVDPRLERWALGELPQSQASDLKTDAANDPDHLALVEIYRPMSRDEIMAVNPRAKRQLTVIEGGRSMLPLLAMAAGLLLIVVAGVRLISSPGQPVAIQMGGPGQPVEDRAIIDLKVEVSGPVKHVGLWVESQGRLAAAGARLESRGVVWKARARAGRLTSGHFGKLNLLAIAGDARCAEPTSAKAAEQSGCAVARWPLTVGPPPVNVEVAAVELTVLGSTSEEGGPDAIVVPPKGKIMLRLTHPDGPISGDITYHVWRRDTAGPWIRLTDPKGLASKDTVQMKLDATQLLSIDARQGELRIESGPTGELRADPDQAPSKAWRTTTLRLIRSDNW